MEYIVDAGSTSRKDVRNAEIYRLSLTMPQHEIAEMYKLSQSRISQIVRKERHARRSWLHAQPLTRCRDCMFFVQRSACWCSQTGRQMRPWDFCSYGERRKDAPAGR